jgi:hypothetical protein
LEAWVAQAEAALVEMAKADDIHGDIWNRAIRNTLDATSLQPVKVPLPALNTMFDISSTRCGTGHIHPPACVFGLLGAMSLVGALLTGFDMAGGTAGNWVHIMALPRFRRSQSISPSIWNMRVLAHPCRLS